MVRRKKSNNPFKMWGSYVGTIISYFTLGINPFFQPFICGMNQNIVIQCLLDPSNQNSTGVIFSNLIFPLTLGFLIGWGIHSLVRRYK